MNPYTEAESELSLESRSFLHRVNDQVRKQIQSITSICIHGEELLRNFHSTRNTEDLTFKQMFDISEKLTVGQSDEIYRKVH